MGTDKVYDDDKIGVWNNKASRYDIVSKVCCVAAGETGEQPSEQCPLNDDCVL